MPRSCRDDCARAVHLQDPHAPEQATKEQYPAGLGERMLDQWPLKWRPAAARPGLAEPDHACTDDCS